MPTVGEILSTERRRQGKQISDVVEGTKIRSRLLDALEQGRYDDLPSPAYVKGYIQSYARYLEIPAEPLLAQFKLEAVDTVRRDTPMDRYLDAIPKETVVPKRGTAHEIPRNVWIVAAAGVILVFLVLRAVTQCSGRGTGPTPTPTTLPSTEGTSASPGATSTAPSTTTTTTASTFKIRISVRTGLASAVKVTLDGLVGYDGTMQGGESHEFQVSKKVVIVIGKPDAVVVTRDGTPVTIPQTPGATVTLTSSK
jgi:cytoskeleton protein RodZ